MQVKDSLKKELKDNEQTLQVFSLEQLKSILEEKNIDYTDWLKTAAGYAAPANDIKLARILLKEFGFSGQAYQRVYKGSVYIILKGNPGSRQIFTGTRYLATNPKIVQMAVGPKGVLKSVKGGFLLTLVLSVGIEVVDYIMSDQRALSHLLGTIASDVIKIGASAIASALAAAIVTGSAAVATSVTLPFIAAIAVGVLTGLALNHLDQKIGATDKLIKMFEAIGINLNQTLSSAMSLPDRIANEIYRWERYYINRALYHARIR